MIFTGINYYFALKQIIIELKIFLLNFVVFVYCELFVTVVFLIISIFYVLSNFKLFKTIEIYSVFKKYVFFKKIYNINFFLFLSFILFYFIFYFNNVFKFTNIWFIKKINFIKNSLDLNFSFDYINIYFILLTLFIFIIVFISINSTKYLNDIYYLNNKIIFFLFFSIELFLILTFATSNIFFFFFFFECSLIPMYVLMILMGKGIKKKHYASLSLVFFTLTGSIFLLFGILYVYTTTCNCDFKNLNFEMLDFNSQIFLFFVFLIGFSVKIPIFPFYSWLPEAHVEAATAVSILLAAIFLKVATYGLLKIVIFNMFLPVYYFYSIIFYFSLFSIITSSFIILIQTDLKKIIAFSSVIHMNYIVLGVFSLDAKAIVASVIYMFSHAFVSSGLFYLVGLIYENTGTRDLLNFSSTLKYSQNFFLFFFLFNLSNVSFPMTVSFIAELMLLNNLFYLNIFIILIILISVFISIIYTFWMVHNIFFGKNNFFKNIIFFNIFDVYTLFYLIFIVFLLGLAPFLILYNLEQEIYLLIINKFSVF